MTCKSRANAEQSRIDGFLVDKEALPLTQGFYVEKDEGIPTHSCVDIKLSRNPNAETKRFARPLPCLKQRFEAKLQHVVETSKALAEEISGKGRKGEEDEEKRNLKQQAETKKEQQRKLHEMMDAKMRGRKETLMAYEEMEDVDGMWEMLSHCVEDA